MKNTCILLTLCFVWIVFFALDNNRSDFEQCTAEAAAKSPPDKSSQLGLNESYQGLISCMNGRGYDLTNEYWSCQYPENFPGLANDRFCYRPRNPAIGFFHDVRMFR